MLRRLEQAARSQKVRILALFVVLAVVAVVAVLAGDDYGEYTGSGFASDYVDYQGAQGEIPTDPWNVAGSDYGEYSGNQFYIPDNNDGGQQQGYIPEPGNDTPGQEENNVGQDPGISDQGYGDYSPEATTAPTITPSPTDAPEPTDAPAQGEGGVGIDPSGGYIQPVPLSDFNVSFNPNLGTIGGIAGQQTWWLIPSGTTVADAAVAQGSEIPGPTASVAYVLERPFHVFAGWQFNVSPSGLSMTITDFTDFASIAVDHDMTFTAQWTPCISISFDFGQGTYTRGGVPVGDPLIREIPPNTALGADYVPQTGMTGGIPQPRIFERAGFHFLGWQETAPGFVSDLAVGLVNTAMLENIIHGTTDRYFRAVWQQYWIVTFNLSAVDIANGATFVETGTSTPIIRRVDSGTNIYAATTRDVDGNFSPGAPVPSMAGAVFTRWYTNPPFVTGGAINGDIGLIAGFSTSEEVTFHLNGGWHLNSVDTGPITIDFPAVPAQIIGEANAPGGANNLPALTRPGWVFGGWQEGTTYTPGGTIVDLDLEMIDLGTPRDFVAVWTRTLIPVTFDPNYTGSTDVILNVYQGANIAYMTGPLALVIPVPTHPGGHTFLGWEANDGTVFAAPFVFLYNLTIPAPMTFTALWDLGMVDVIFDLNGGFNTMLEPGPLVTRSRPVGAQILIANVPAPTRENHTFAGWLYQSGDGVTRTRASTAALTVASGGALFIAQWDHIRHDVTFILSGGLYFGSSDNVVRSVRQGFTILNDTLIIPAGANSVPEFPDLVHPTHTFVGWQRVGDPFGSPLWTPASAAALVIGSPETFIAVWDIDIFHDVTFVLNGGNILGNTNNVIRTVLDGTTIGTPSTTPTSDLPPFPTMGGQTFVGWWRSSDGQMFNASNAAELNDLLNNFVVTGPAILLAIWSDNLTQVVFHLAGGNIAGDATTPITRINMPVGLAIGSINVPNPTRENYIFMGWEDENGVGLSSAQVGLELATAMPNYREFTAVWTPVNHVVTFVLNGGNISGSTAHVEMWVPHGSIVNNNIAGLGVPMPPALVRPGYSFTGWWLSNMPPTVASPGGFVVTGPAFFVAQWLFGNELADVIFDLNGGTFGGNPANIEFTGLSGRPVGHPLGALVPDPVVFANRVFLYWINTNDGTTSSSMEIAAWLVTAGSTTWVAQWYLPEHQVTFFFYDTAANDPNDFESFMVDNGAGIPFGSVPTRTRQFYTLIGWRLDGVGPILDITDIEGMLVNSPLTFIAVWRRNTHDIIFDLDGGEYDSSTADVLVVAREGEPLDRVPAPTREHYLLTGWRWLDPATNTWVYFTPTEIATTIVSDDPGDMTFVAVWQRIEHTVTFVLNGGNIGGNTANIVEDIAQGTVIGTASVPGPIDHPTSTFTHWLREDTNTLHTSDQVATITVVATPGALRFIAQWDVRSYDVTFMLDGGNVGGSTADITHNLFYQSTIGGNVPEPVKATYTLMGWRVVSGAAITGNIYSPIQVAGRVVEGDISFEAEWVQMPQRVTFDLNGGDVAGSTADITVFISEGSALGNVVPAPTMGASVFNGWRINGVGQIFNMPTMADFIVTQPTTFVALWDHDIFEVTFVLNGGEFNGSPANVVVEIAEGYEIATAVPAAIREHWTLLGWREDGQGPTLLPADVADIVVDDDMTFVAVWQRNQHSVTFILAGGQVAGSEANISLTVDAGEEIGLVNVPVPTRLGSSFTGWRLDGAGVVLNRAEVGDVVVTDALVYIAVWDANFFPVSFDLAGGNVAGSTASIQHNILAGATVGSGLIPNPTRLNYSLSGWQRDGQGAALSTAYIASIEVDQPISFAAIWSPILHNIVFDINGGNIAGNTSNVVNPVAQGVAIGTANVAASPVLAGSTFTGWREDGTAVVRTPAQVAELIASGTMRFIAQWDDVPVPITFVLNGGNVAGATANIEAAVIHGRAVGAAVVPLAVRTDYELSGWLLAANTLTPLQVAATHVYEALTFTAQWAPITHPVTFILDGGTYSGSTANVVRQINQNATITVANVPAPTRGTSVFSGWREFGEQITLTPAQVAALTITGPRIFVAVWDAQEFEVIFDLAGGNVAGATVNITRTVIGGDRIGGHNVPEPTRGYFVHSGWRLNNAGAVLTGVQVAGVEVTGDLSYTAVWTPVSRDVILGRDPYTASIPGHATTAYTYTVNTGANIDVTFIIVPPGNGAIFTQQSIAIPPVGYFIVAGPTILENGNMEVTIRRMTGGDLELPEFTVTFNPMAGSLPAGEPGFRRGVHGTRIDTFPVANPPAGYEFIGWFYTNARIIPSMIITRDITLTAGFQPTGGTGQMFTVIHNPAGGFLPHGVIGTNQHVYGTALYNHPIPTRAGYMFSGWTHNGAPIPVPLIVRSNITLFATWVPDHVVPTPPPGWQWPTPPPWPTPPAWSTPPPWPTPPPWWCQEPPHNIPSNFYIVAFNPHPGVHSAPGETGIRVGVRNSVVHNIPATPVHTGHVFGGWRLPNGSVLTGPLTITGNMTLTAIWTPVGGGGATPGPSSKPPGQPGNRPNPQTDPIQVSFLIFGAVLLTGVAAYTVLKLAKKHAEAADQYLVDTTRYNREKRITDMFRRKPKK